MSTRRDPLQSINVRLATNASLWLDKFLTKQESQSQQRDNEQDTPKQILVNETADISTPPIYKQFFWRCKQALKEIGAQMKTLTVDGRMIVGLGAESVLETSIALHRTYGVPYIPGSALKGLVAFYARQALDEKLWRKDSPAYQTIFGSQASSGYIMFHDALYIPTEDQASKPLHADILTVHHQDYYQGKAAPADWDNPVPVPLLSATGNYLVALSGVSGTERWIIKTFEILDQALAQYGIGAKTSSGYGRGSLSDQIPTSAEEKQGLEKQKAQGRLDKLMERLQQVQSNNKEAKQEFREMIKSLRKLEPEQKQAGARALLVKVEELGMRDELTANQSQWYEEAKRMADEGAKLAKVEKLEVREELKSNQSQGYEEVKHMADEGTIKMEDKPLKVFISYKWEDASHNRWVEKFATDLRSAGIEAILDKWEVRFGDSFTDYMTRKIAEADIVLFIMTTRSVAAVEAQPASGGAVKFEIEMAKSRRIAGESMRLIGIYREGNQTPMYLRDHRYADFRDDSQYDSNFQELIDDLLGKDKRPPLRRAETRSPVEKIIEKGGEVGGNVATPSVSMWIHGWDKQTYEPAPTIELNWTKYFDWETRRIASQEDWDKELFPQLKAAKERFNQRSDGRFIDLRGKLPLTVSLAVGFMFPIVAGYRFRVEQPTERGTFLWYSNGVNSSERAFKVVEERDIAGGADLLIAFSVSGKGLKDVRELANQIQNPVKAMVYFEPGNGAGKTAITCNEDAVSLAIQAVELIRDYRDKYETQKTNLVVFSPMSFSLFLGQRLSSLGEIITYERTREGGYQSSAILKTR